MSLPAQPVTLSSHDRALTVQCLELEITSRLDDLERSLGRWPHWENTDLADAAMHARGLADVLELLARVARDG